MCSPSVPGASVPGNKDLICSALSNGITTTTGDPGSKTTTVQRIFRQRPLGFGYWLATLRIALYPGVSRRVISRVRDDSLLAALLVCSERTPRTRDDSVLAALLVRSAPTPGARDDSLLTTQLERRLSLSDAGKATLSRPYAAPSRHLFSRERLCFDLSSLRYAQRLWKQCVLGPAPSLFGTDSGHVTGSAALPPVNG